MSSYAEILTAVVFLPTIGALLLALMPAKDHTNLKGAAVAVSLVTFFVSISLWTGFNPADPGFQFTASLRWIPRFNIRYNIGLDGISLVLVMLTTFLVPITLVGSWTAITDRVKEFLIAMLVLETGMLGAFISLDLFLFYVFWEAMLIPMYFMIGIWGGQRRIYAAVKFFIFTMAGSLLMLIAILFVARQPGGGWDFSLAAAYGRAAGPHDLLLFLAFAIAFAIKVPMFPVHTWLPDAHTEAPTPGSVILAGVLLKLGVYGFIRFAFPIFPAQAMAMLPWFAWLGIIGIIYGALLAWVQPDMKKLVAYSSVSHLGFCVLGLAAMSAEAVNGSIFIMIAHGISTGGLFLLVGVLYERRHTRALDDYGGIAKQVPIFTFFLGIMVMASAGLPALCGFPGEFMVLLGTFTSHAGSYVWAFFAAFGVILAAVYLLWMMQKVLFGKLDNPKNQTLKDMNLREVLVILPLVFMAFVLGLQPGVVTSRIRPSVDRFVQRMHGDNYRPDTGVYSTPTKIGVLIKSHGITPKAGEPEEPEHHHE